MKKINGRGIEVQSKSKRVGGFTLIEMLTVIAIMGILLTIAIVSFQSSKDKANIALVKNSLQQIRSQAEAIYNKKGCYVNSASVCMMDGPAEVIGSESSPCPTSGDSIFVDSKIMALLDQTTNARSLYTCKSNHLGTSWAIAMSYKSDPTKGWCLNNSGDTEEFTLASGANVSALNAKMTQNADGSIVCN